MSIIYVIELDEIVLFKEKQQNNEHIGMQYTTYTITMTIKTTNTL